MYKLVVKGQELVCVFSNKMWFLSKLVLLLWTVWAVLVHGTKYNFIFSFMASLQFVMTRVWYLSGIAMICLFLSHTQKRYYCIIAGFEALF